jgi:hypothetical protein
MKTVVIMPGGFHPFHAGHMALYQSAREEFPDADVYVAATDDTSARPFPFAVKEKLARLAGVEPGHFVKVKSPFSADEITSRYNPAEDRVIFVRSEKDRGSKPQPGGMKKDGTPAKLQPLDANPEPFGKHLYMTYLPTVEFGPGLTSATEIRTAWPTLNDKRKTALVMSLYPATQRNPALAANVVKMLDTAILGSEQLNEFLPVLGALAGRALAGAGASALTRTAAGMAGQAVGSEIQDRLSSDDEDYLEEKWSQKYKSSINCANPKGFSQQAHCAGRKK